MQMNIVITGHDRPKQSPLGKALMRFLESLSVPVTENHGKVAFFMGGTPFQEIEVTLDAASSARLVASSDMPARIKNLDKRAREANKRADEAECENKIMRKRLGIAEHHAILPRNIYYSAHDSRFRDAETHSDMGDAFLAKWGEQWTRFPVNPNAPSMSDLVSALKHAKKGS